MGKGGLLPIADSALLSAKLLKKGALRVYEKFPHGMCTTHADIINADLLAFIRGEDVGGASEPKIEVRIVETPTLA